MIDPSLNMLSKTIDVISRYTNIILLHLATCLKKGKSNTNIRITKVSKLVVRPSASQDLVLLPHNKLSKPFLLILWEWIAPRPKTL